MGISGENMKTSSNRLGKISGRLVTAAVVAALSCGPALVAAQDSQDVGDTKPSGAAMLFDLALGRPLGLGATVLGTAVFIVGLPFEALSGDVSAPARRLVVEPGAFTFVRPLGEFN
jgi:hypothetical protein